MSNTKKKDRIQGSARRSLLRNAMFALAGGGTLKADSGGTWSPKKQVVGLGQSQSANGALLSPCIRSGHLLFVAGIAGWYPGRRREPGDAKVQIQSALTTMKELLKRAGSSMENVLKVSIALVDPEKNLDALNEGYREFFSKAPPARSFFGTSGLRRKECLLQIDCIAYVD
jgi:2-iminobutanoate/2-iminopropanoate deaminase